MYTEAPLESELGLSSENYIGRRKCEKLGGGEGLSLKYGVSYWQKCGVGNKASCTEYQERNLDMLKERCQKASFHKFWYQKA